MPISIFKVPGRKVNGIPGDAEGKVFLALLERVLDQTRPDIMLTYGGHWLARRIMDAASRRGIRVVSPCTTSLMTRLVNFFAKWMPSWCPPDSPRLITGKLWVWIRRRFLGLGTGPAFAAEFDAVMSPSSILNPIKASLFSPASPRNWPAYARIFPCWWWKARLRPAVGTNRP